MNYIAKLVVYEENLKEACKETMADEKLTIDDMSYEEMIQQELEWVGPSGIYCESVSEDKREELWDKIQALSQQVFWKEQQRVSDGISLSDLKEVMKEYTIS